MFREAGSSSGSNASTKGDEVELVSRFLAPLCARDEAARNIALEAARSTVEGWLGGVGSPNHWEETGEMEDATIERFGKCQDGRYDIQTHIQRSPTKSVPRIVQHRQLSFGSEGFFPQSVTEAPVFPEDGNPEGKLSSSYDCCDGRQISDSLERRRHLAEGFESYKSGNSSSDEGKGHCRVDSGRRFRFREEGLDPSEDSFEHPRRHSSTRDSPGETGLEERQSRSKNVVKVKGARTKQSEDNELDSGTRIYGKSPKFDDEGPFFEPRKHSFRGKNAEELSVDEVYHSGVVFNTLEGFEDENPEKLEDEDCPRKTQERKFSAGQIKRPLSQDENMSFGLHGFLEENLGDEIARRTQDFQRKKDERKFSVGQIKRPLSQDESMSLEAFDGPEGFPKDKIQDEGMRCPRTQDFQRKNEERKFSAGQIKRPLSQDEEQEVKTGRVFDSPEVTPGDVGRLLNLGNALDGPRQAQPNKYLSLVSLHLPVILRLSVNCPFQNVRIKCAEILDMVKDRGLAVPIPAFDGPSAFVPTSELPDLNNLDEKTHILLMDAFLQNNRLDHVSRVMSSHPSYLEHFLRTQHFILRGDGPLPYDYRHLIAIMAAGRHQCSYLINLQKGEFLLQGGDPSWLQGLRSIPSKLQDLYEINKILAHRPWLLNKTHIEKLTKGADNWSLAEVVHAIVLLAHFHSLSSFVFSCGINEELDNVAGHHYKEDGKDAGDRAKPAKEKLISSSPKKIPNGDGKTETQPSPPSSPSIVGEQEVGVETLMERMKRLSEKSESYEITQEELSKRFETVETQSAELAAAPQRNSTVLDSDIGLFIEDPSFIYQDFAKRGQLNDIPTFRVQDYSWDDHGYSLVNRLYNDVGNLLDDKFKTAYNLTYYTMGQHSKVDTSRFRRAIWNYIQCMFGIRHDDYDYNEVNQLLERSLKTFIKSAVCYPERVTKRDYDRVMREFKHSEKVHVNLMILEARMQAELLYALRAVMRYMT